MYHCSFICLSTGEVECKSSCFATTLLHISASAICHRLRFLLINCYIGRPFHKLHVAISTGFPIALISIRCVVFTANNSEVLTVGMS